MMDQFNVTNEIVALLEADERLAAITGKRFFPIDAPTDTPGDFIVYQRDGYRQTDTKTGIATRTPVVLVTCVSDRYRTSQQMASLVFDILSGTFTNPYMEIRLEDSTEDRIGKKFIQVLQFSVTI